MAMVDPAYKLGGRWKEVEELEVQMMETRKRVLSEEHPDMLNSMANVADAPTTKTAYLPKGTTATEMTV